MTRVGSQRHSKEKKVIIIIIIVTKRTISNPSTKHLSNRRGEYEPAQMHEVGVINIFVLTNFNHFIIIPLLAIIFY
jgi:hypothetical protein